MKPLRPFPFPFNIGVDICQISRIYGILYHHRGSRFVDRILAPEERACHEQRLLYLKHNLHESRRYESPNRAQSTQLSAEVAQHRDPEMWKIATFIAGRFAAKEAAIKAHSHRRLTFHDIIIERRGRDEERLGSGPPVARIRGETDADDDVSAMISISHDGDYATAVCMAYDPSVVRSQSNAEGKG